MLSTDVITNSVQNNNKFFKILNILLFPFCSVLYSICTNFYIDSSRNKKGHRNVVIKIYNLRKRYIEFHNLKNPVEIVRIQMKMFSQNSLHSCLVCGTHLLYLYSVSFLGYSLCWFPLLFFPLSFKCTLGQSFHLCFGCVHHCHVRMEYKMSLWLHWLYSTDVSIQTPNWGIMCCFIATMSWKG